MLKPEKRDAAFSRARQALRDARARHGRKALHRSIGRIALTPGNLAYAIGLPILLWILLVGFKAELMALWRAVMDFWLAYLGVPLRSVAPHPPDADIAFAPLAPGDAFGLPGTTLMLATAAVSVAGWALSYRLQREKMPLRYLVRILCGIQLSATAAIWFFPASFSFTAHDHVAGVVNNGYRVMLAIPFMLGAGYYVFNANLLKKTWYTAIIFGYFVVMIPHKAVVHGFLLQHGSVLFMPLLYMCFGTTFDVLAFIALYSWAASNLPEQTLV
ncbi:MAG TPA: hypothetical protein VJ698_23430 [Noviherbaspirillum sp.]|uniref:hypothetical protein n=1 Tax=Noviherbaspirillum sp. TaxID=1926288 RepID=UPI002B476F21|nr:hypothetical protein [Noviherbaspirillum sp.]HJV88437.1 hypothetical protein [Noviherbaspirillum sp.]